MAAPRLDVDDSDLDARIRSAIARRRLLQFNYHGSRRVAEPHDYGIRSGCPRLLAYQRLAWDGDIERQRAHGWRWLDIQGISDCTILEETFSGSRGEQHQRHHAWDVLYARVK